MPLAALRPSSYPAPVTASCATLNGNRKGAVNKPPRPLPLALLKDFEIAFSITPAPLSNAFVMLSAALLPSTVCRTDVVIFAFIAAFCRTDLTSAFSALTFAIAVSICWVWIDTAPRISFWRSARSVETCFDNSLSCEPSYCGFSGLFLISRCKSRQSAFLEAMTRLNSCRLFRSANGASGVLAI